MEYDPILRRWFCSICGRLYRMTTLRDLRGYVPADRWLVGQEDGDA